MKLLVYNTSISPPDNKTIQYPIFKVIHRLEEYLFASKLKAIMICPPLYLDNLLAPWIQPLIYEQMVVSYPLQADLKINWSSYENVARSVVAALERPQLAGKRLEVAGIEATSGREIAQCIADQLKQDICYDAVDPQTFGTRVSSILGEQCR